LREISRLDLSPGARYPDGRRESRYCGRTLRLPSLVRFELTTVARGVNGQSAFV